MGLNETIVAVVAAVLADLVFGEPPARIHPVRLFGLSVSTLQTLLRRVFPRGRWDYLAGLLLVLILVTAAFGLARLLLAEAFQLSYPLGFAVAVGLIYVSISQRELARVANVISDSLRVGDSTAARAQLTSLVGRDTESLRDAEVLRGGLESVAENTNDGVVAPLFFALILGPPGAVLFRAVNTLDSMVGYRTDAYHRFGWVAAKLDDLLGLVPARLTGLGFVLAALSRRTATRALSMMLREARSHPSPNAGFPEAAMAGALEVRLGGVNYYQGQAKEYPYLGNCVREFEPAMLEDAVRLMYLNTAIFLGFVFVLYLVTLLWFS